MTDEYMPPVPPIDPTALDKLCQQARVERMQRMADPSQPLTDEQRANIIDRINNFLATNQAVTQTQLSRMAGVGTRLGEILKGTYTVKDLTKIDEVLRNTEAAIANLQNKMFVESGDQFVRTRIAQAIFSILKTVSAHGGMGAFSLSSGFGKTTALEAARKMEFPNALYIPVNPGTGSPLMLCRAMLRFLRTGSAVPGPATTATEATEGISTVGNGFNKLIGRLVRTQRLIILDEAENLTNEGFNLARMLHDATGKADGTEKCPIVFAGRSHLQTVIEKTYRDPRIGAALASRLVANVDLEESLRGPDGGKPLFTVDEVMRVLRKFRVTFDPGAARWLCGLASIGALGTQKESGGLRRAEYVGRQAAFMNPGATITADMCREAFQLLASRAVCAEAEVKIAELSARLVASDARRAATA